MHALDLFNTFFQKLARASPVVATFRFQISCLSPIIGILIIYSVTTRKNMSNIRSEYSISEHGKVCLQCGDFRPLKLVPSFYVFPKDCDNMGM